MHPLLITAIFVALLGALVITIGFQNRRAVMEALAWPIVPAVITSSECHSDGEGGYQPFVSYSYEMGGRKYLGSTLLNAPDAVKRERLENYIAKMYAVGRRIYVSVNPKDSADSILEPDSSRGHILIQLVLGSVLLIAALVILITYFLD